MDPIAIRQQFASTMARALSEDLQVVSADQDCQKLPCQRQN